MLWKSLTPTHCCNCDLYAGVIKLKDWQEENMNRDAGRTGPTIVRQMLRLNNNQLSGLRVSGKLVGWGEGACQSWRISWRQSLMER